jgi:putative ABC transport system permease protein
MFAKLAIKSLLDRKGSVMLALVAMAVSVYVLLGVEHIRNQAKENFSSTVSGVDLIVGARTGSLNLLLYSVFRIGSATNNIQWQSFEDLKNDPKIKWAIPLSLGDSHKGFRVLGTNEEYFQHFSYAQGEKLKFADGVPFNGVFDVVLGSGVAEKLNYKIGDKIIVSHGLVSTSFSMHDDRPFTVVGILKPTGTPVDQTLHVSLQGIEAIHIDWRQGTRIPNSGITQDMLEQAKDRLQPKSITAAMLGLNSKIATFAVQRQINNYKAEPLMAILPGVALSDFWNTLGFIEKTLFLVSALVFIAACLGVSAMLLSSIRERSQEIQLLRVIGASALFLFFLIQIEALLITLLSILLAVTLLSTTIYFANDFLVSEFGLHISAAILSSQSLIILGLILIVTFVIALIPALYAYRNSTEINS